MQISFLILAFVLIALIPCAAYRIPRTKPTGRMGKMMNSWEEFDGEELVMQVMGWIGCIVYLIVAMLLEP